MNFFKTPSWLDQFQFPFESFDQIPNEVFDQINCDLDKIQKPDPLVSIVIAAWNEEINILKCVASLSKMRTEIPLEIIVINNNSKDNTQKTLDQLHVKSLFEIKQGCGPARQLGQENAAGKYILLADADCLYPDCWVDEMIKVLSKQDVVCVYGRYSFLNEVHYPRWQLAIFEKMKDVVAEYRHINRPYFNAYGISMGFIKELGLRVGFIQTGFWGDDGQLCLALMKYGKVKQVRSNKARAWTSPRTLQRDGGFGQALRSRLIKELKRFTFNLHSKLPKDQDFGK
ncbi:glycosyltransferase family 2 protein [Daejeonella lutea]|uniref:Glycosyltransferase involved in cell wall bisynthesis n=1 Tax=Daejeonella lutea TaxID=572036 RepID=A0A1T5EEZ6_9SPHI|nr:glycosyltransferase family 2 protein [Daejeonella lutea]SKB82355.1 Glycosyltransferase involved in cell wall bisynthesis [Daejeonella lutea]